MAASIVDVTEAQLEKVRPKLEMYFERTDQIAGLVKKTDEVVQQSRRLYRIPFKQYQGGTYGKFSGNRGSLGEGTNMLINDLTAGYLYSRLGFEVTLEQIQTTQNTSQSVINVLSDTLANAITEGHVYDDIAFHTDGSGVLTNAASAEGGTTLTFAGATDTLRANRLREGMAVSVWDTGLTTERSGAGSGPIIITSIDWDAELVTFNQTVTALASTDRLAFQNVATYGPATPTSFSATWPATGVAAGLGGDSFRHGYLYSNDATTSNRYLTILKSAVPQLLASRVNASSSALTFSHGLQILDKLYRRRSPQVVNGLIGIAHFAQRAQVFNTSITIANKFITGEKYGTSTDLMPANRSYTDTFNFCDIKCYVSKRQDKARFDFINPGKWGRAQLGDMDYFSAGGRTVFELRNSSGEILAGVQFFLVQNYDFVNFDPGCQGFIDSLTIPAGY